MTLQAFWQIFWLQTALSLLVFLLGFYRYNERSICIKLVCLLFGLSFLCNVISYLIKSTGLVNVPGSIYDVLSFVIICVIYHYAFNKQYAKFFFIISIVFTIISVINLFYYQQTDNASFNKLISAFVVIVLAIAYFYRLLLELPTSHIQRLPMFWINSSFLIYSAGSLFLFAFTTYIIKVLDNDLLGYWSYHNALSIIEHIIILFAITYDIQYPQRYNSQKSYPLGN
jgi:hypothetical protein